MGIMPTFFDASIGENGAYCALEPWLWPALEGQSVASYVQSMVENRASARVLEKNGFIRTASGVAED